MPPSLRSHSSTGGQATSPYTRSTQTSSTRQTTHRTNAELQSTEIPVDVIDIDDIVLRSTPSTSQSSVAGIFLPESLTKSITGLNKRDLATLRKKRQWLREFEITIPPVRNGIDATKSVNATLVFAQEDAGTAVCINPAGILLTCSHCIAESAEELEDQKTKWLIFASGQVVQADCIYWDPIRDLALLRIVACQCPPATTPTSSSSSTSSGFQSFPYVIPADFSPPLRAVLLCIGHPGSEDLEAKKPGIKTNYDVLHVSTGKFRGYAPGQDVQNNAEIGALMHDCWTYWGHSGAPLIDQRSGRLVGLHSSWDDRTGMRRGIGLEAVKAFLSEHEDLWKCV